MLTTPFDPIASVVALTELARKRLVNDLKAIPADRLGVSPGGVARTPLSIVAECAAVNAFIATFLTTGSATRPPLAEREALYATFVSLDQTLAFLDEQTAVLLDAIRGLDPATLSEILDKPLHRPMTRFALAELPATHMMYHDGQLAYVQALGGDAENHW